MQCISAGGLWTTSDDVWRPSLFGESELLAQNDDSVDVTHIDECQQLSISSALLSNDAQQAARDYLPVSLRLTDCQLTHDEDGGERQIAVSAVDFAGRSVQLTNKKFELMLMKLAKAYNR